jgi:hypothetical protein
VSLADGEVVDILDVNRDGVIVGYDDYPFIWQVTDSSFNTSLVYKSVKTKEEKTKSDGRNCVNFHLQEEAVAGGIDMSRYLSLTHTDIMTSSTGHYEIKNDIIVYNTLHAGTIKRNFTEDTITLWLDFTKIALECVKSNSNHGVAMGICDILPLRAQLLDTVSGAYVKLLMTSSND